MADVDTPATNGEKETRAKDTINTPDDVSEDDNKYLEVYRDILHCVKFLFHSSSRTEEQDENSSTPSEDPSLEPQSKTELSKVLQQITSLVNHEKPTTQFTCSPDHHTHTSVISHTLSLYLSLLDESCIKKLSACIRSDCSHWLSKLFSYENALSCFHEHQWEGLVKVCRLALRVKYPKFATEGFTALYTRPPVVYVSSSACNALGYYLCTQTIEDLKFHITVSQREQGRILGFSVEPVTCNTCHGCHYLVYHSQAFVKVYSLTSITLNIFQTNWFALLHRVLVPCNTVFGSPHTMDIAAFERLFNDDISCGKTPLLLIAHAGTPVAGHTDNLSRLRELCTQNGLWLHVEGDTLGTLCLETVPSSLKSAPASDSMTLSINKWFSLPSAPYCTFYRAKDLDLAEASGLNQSHGADRLSVLPLWISIQTIGLDKMREMIMHAVQLSQQLCISLDGMQATVNRITQPHCMSPVVVFKYKASPIPLNGRRIQEETEESVSDQEEDQDDAELSTSSASSLPEAGSIPSSSRDLLNRMIAKHLAREVPSVNTDIVELPKEGCCIRFNPLHSARVCGTTSENVEDFVICLKEEVARLDARILSQAAFTLAAEGKEHLVTIEAQDTSSVGALLCIPRYWTNKDVEKLREAKKVELNEWNKEVLAKVSEEMADVFSKGRTEEGLTCIVINTLPPTSSVEGVVDFICQAATELENSSKYLEQMADAIQKGIEAAKNDLVKDAEEKLMEEGLLRQVPLVSSFVNWLSPLPEEPKTMGRTFNLTSGHLHTTEKIYKYHMQVQDEDEEEEAVAVTPTKLSPAKTEPSPLKDGIEG